MFFFYGLIALGLLLALTGITVLAFEIRKYRKHRLAEETKLTKENTKSG